MKYRWNDRNDYLWKQKVRVDLPWVWHWAKGFKEAGPLPGTKATNKLDQVGGVGVGNTLVYVNTNFVYYVNKHLVQEFYIISAYLIIKYRDVCLWVCIEGSR